MQLLIMFVIGFMQPTTELHFLSYGIEEKNAGFWYSLNTLAYAISSLLVSFTINLFHKPRIMVLGGFIMSAGLMLVGPSPLLFTPSLLLVGLGFFLVGLAGGFIYGIL